MSVLDRITRFLEERVTRHERELGVGIRINRVHTGRSVDVSRGYYTVRELGGLSRRQLYVSPMAWLIAKDLLRSPRRTLEHHEVYFRGRRFEDVEPKHWQAMGPPPKIRHWAALKHSDRKGGRYNGPGSAVLYLASTVEGVRAELGSMRLCTQEYRPTGLEVVDLTKPNSDLLGAAFDLAESVGVTDRGPAAYTFSQFLGMVLRWSGADGFVVPGVRGDASSRYTNLVILRPEPGWTAWSSRDDGFRVDPG
jgi:RES domain-containing protein